MLAFVLLTLGGFVMFFAERINVRRVLPIVLASAGLFGLVNVLQKVAYNHTNFVTAYVFFTVGTFIAAMSLLLHRTGDGRFSLMPRGRSRAAGFGTS